MARSDSPDPLLVDTFCTIDNYDQCIKDYGCCLSIEQLQRILVYLYFYHYFQVDNIQDYIDQYGDHIPPMRDMKDFWAALVCLVAHFQDDDRTGLELWNAAQAAGFNKASPTDLRRLFLALACYEMNLNNGQD